VTGLAIGGDDDHEQRDDADREPRREIQQRQPAEPEYQNDLLGGISDLRQRIATEHRKREALGQQRLAEAIAAQRRAQQPTRNGCHALRSSNGDGRRPGALRGSRGHGDQRARRIADSKAKNVGKAAGRKAAAAELAARAGDGLDVAAVNAPFTPPPPDIGAWRPTPPAFASAVQAGQGSAKPFLIPDVATRFVAPAPAAID
jgi:hypothetical protein